MKNPKTVPATVEGFWKRVDDEKTGRICAELADLLEARRRGEISPEDYKTKKAKVKLESAFYTPHAHFLKGYKSSEGEPVDSGKAIVDLDGCEHFPELYSQRLMGRERELGINMVNRSVSGTGGHILFDIPECLDRQQAQAWMCQLLGGVDYDKAVHERERAIYIPCREYILYIDEELMFSDELHPHPSDIIHQPSDIIPHPSSLKPQTSSIKHHPSNIILQPSLRALAAFDETLRMTELDLETLNRDGVRHNTLKLLLPTLCQMMPQEELLGVLQQKMPEYSKEEDCTTLVSNFYEKYVDQNRPMNLKQKEVFLRSLKAEKEPEFTQGEASLSLTPPEMPKKLPRLVELLTSKTPDVYKPAVAHAIFPPLATHLCDVRFRYTDNKKHEATLMNCLMAGTGSGKGCIDDPIRYIMADIQRRDKENERREAEWKKDCQKRGANKDKLLRPEGLVIQIIDPDMTKPALVTRMDEAEGHFVYVKLNELDLFEQLKGQTGKQHFQLMCLAFDPDAEYGQTRVGTQSVTARPMCRFNWNACTTILKGRRFFRKVLTDGPISRINFCTIPEQEIGAQQPVFGQYDLKFEEALKPYIDNLVNARGQIDCPQAYRLAKRMQEEVAEFSTLSQNWTYWNLSHRACVIAWLKACVLYVANGQKWERAIEDFVRWSLQYDLWCKMQFFGKEIDQAESGEDSRIGTRGPRNLLELLPDEFTIDDAKRIRQQQGMDSEKTGNMVSTWKKRDYVVQMADGSFQKTTKYKVRN